MLLVFIAYEWQHKDAIFFKFWITSTNYTFLKTILRYHSIKSQIKILIFLVIFAKLCWNMVCNSLNITVIIPKHNLIVICFSYESINQKKFHPDKECTSPSIICLKISTVKLFYSLNDDKFNKFTKRNFFIFKRVKHY